MANQIKIKQTIAPNQGSIIFSGPNGVLSENNNQFYWDHTNHLMGIGTNNPASKLTVFGDKIEPTIDVYSTFSSSMPPGIDISYAARFTHQGTSSTGRNVGLLTRSSSHGVGKNIGLISLAGPVVLNASLLNETIGIYSQVSGVNTIGYKHVDANTSTTKNGIDLSITGTATGDVKGISTSISSGDSTIYGNKLTINSTSSQNNFGNHITISNGGTTSSIGSFYDISGSGLSTIGNKIITKGNPANALYGCYVDITQGLNTNEVCGFKAEIDSTADIVYGLKSSISGSAAVTNYGIHSEINGTAPINVAGFFSARNGTTDNYALIAVSGKVGIGTSSPVKDLHIASSQIRISNLATPPAAGYVLAAINSNGDLDWKNPSTLPGTLSKHVEIEVALTTGIPYTVVHNLGLYVVTEVWDRIANKIINLQIFNRTPTSFDVISTTTVVVDIIVIG